MEAAKREVEKQVGFSFNPEVLGADAEGHHIVLDANHCVILGSVTQGTVYYSPRDNKYYGGVGSKELDRDIFEKKILPYLRWDYDQLEEEVLVTERPDEKGAMVSVPLKTGRIISKFPPTPENIKAKRDEYIKAALTNGEQPDLKKLYNKTSPNRLLNNEEYEAKMDRANPTERLLRRYNTGRV